MLNLSKMKVENLKISRETLITLKRMKINTLADLTKVHRDFLQKVKQHLLDVHESQMQSVLFDITTLIESISVKTVARVYDENKKVYMAKGIGIDYPDNICNCLSNFDDFMKVSFSGHTNLAMRYVQDMVEGRTQKGVLSAVDCTLLKLRFKYLYTYKDIGKIVGKTGASVEDTILKALRRLNSWLGSLSDDSDNIEKLQLSVRAFNCLKRAGIHTCSQLKLLKKDDLMKIRNMGERTCNEILSIIKSLE